MLLAVCAADSYVAKTEHVKHWKPKGKRHDLIWNPRAHKFKATGMQRKWRNFGNCLRSICIWRPSIQCYY